MFSARTFALSVLVMPIIVGSLPAVVFAQASSVVADDVQRAHDQALTDSQRVLQNGMKQIAWERQRADADIAKVNQWVDEQMRDVHPTIYWPGMTGPIPNEDYQPTLRRVEGQAKKKIADINERFERDKKVIEADTQRRVAALGDSERDTLSQTKPGNGGMQVTPKGSSSYVRNVVNYSDEPILVKPVAAQTGVWTAPKAAGRR